MNENNETNLSSLDIYMNKVFSFLIILIPAFTLCAGTTFTVIKALGYYPTVSWYGLAAFDLSCIVYFVVGITLAGLNKNSEGYLKPRILKYGKIFILILILIQWNFISYMIPSREFWAYASFFILCGMPFLDSKMVLASEIEILVSIAISWQITGNTLLPYNDSLYVPNMILRGVLLILDFFALWIIVLIIETRLVPELERNANVDRLTLLQNRRSLDFSKDNIMNAAVKEGKIFTVLMCDLDDFKNVNDTFGHDCGDIVLKNVANSISCNVDSKDRVFRYGGEEILAVIETDNDTALKVAERIRADVERSRIHYEDKEIGVTLTIGAAHYKSGCQFDELVKQADDNLYIGKNNGKNQVVAPTE